MNIIIVRQYLQITQNIGAGQKKMGGGRGGLDNEPPHTHTYRIKKSGSIKDKDAGRWNGSSRDV